MRNHILLIDDDFDEVTFLCAALTDAAVEHKCTWARNVEEALGMLSRMEPDAIFIDMNMPRINGLEGIRQIRMQPKLQQVPLVLYSTCINDPTRQDALHNGATCCIQKPYSLSELERLLTIFLHSPEYVSYRSHPPRQLTTFPAPPASVRDQWQHR